MNLRSVLIALLVTAPLVAVFLRGMRSDPRFVPPAIPGQPAPDFALVRMPMNADETQSDTVRLSDFRGKVVVLNFWASWCGPCRIEHPELVATARAYRDRDVVVLGILYNDQQNAARAWLREMGGEEYPTLLDPGTRTAIDYGLTGVPETVIVDRNGTVAFKRIGIVDREMLAREIEPLLARSGPDPADADGHETAPAAELVGSVRATPAAATVEEVVRP